LQSTRSNMFYHNVAHGYAENTLSFSTKIVEQVLTNGR
jgi:hypothetical protein